MKLTYEQEGGFVNFRVINEHGRAVLCGSAPSLGDMREAVGIRFPELVKEDDAPEDNKPKKKGK